MSEICSKCPENKKEYISELGQILITDFGKKEFYKPEEVDKAHKKSSFSGFDFNCWGSAVFSEHSEFDRYHEQTGEVCDYASMKTEMLTGISDSNASNWFGLPDFNIDLSWVDLAEIGFSAVLESIIGVFE